MDSNLNVHQKIVEISLKNYHSNENPWKLATIGSVGRGLIATRDINVNELIFCEPPLLIGPVGNEKDDLVCSLCYKPITETDKCSDCSLPVCPSCSEMGRHVECSFLKSLNLHGKGSLQMVRSLTAIRGLFLDESEKEVLNLLQCNRTGDIVNSINNLLNEGNESSENARDELIRVASVLSTNAFQIVSLSNHYHLNLRGLYPLMSLINHSCTANARYCTDTNYVTSLYARKPIKMGEQISISYAKVLWSTPSRQSYLKLTKHFTCKCSRCMDPTEASTFLAAVKCFDRTCSGLTLPIDPTSFVSAWKCQTCSALSEYRTVLGLQEVVSCMMKGIVDNDSIREIDGFIGNRLLKVLPVSSQYVVELKMKIATINVKDLSISECKLVEKCCQDILQLLDKLEAGECTLKGLVELKLFQCRQLLMETGKKSMTEFESNQQRLLMNAWSILKDNIAAPANLSDTVEKYVLCKIQNLIN
ncbi:SET domain-containing protein SmydA-8-like [Bradysia coprophila]|uniref:SET domain-containing protein SmydA-8-like n=1 Tax=Bradysia coprophila TaxID=38358 RepID=UPI00187D9A3F|nr:SET domain-containing protein SmydA-8-like [Bradysia coprophila]